MKDRFICPQPSIWNDIYQKLLDAHSTSGDPSIPPPPVPLILAAWWGTPALFKTVRWNETVAWAEEYGFIHLIPELSDEESYFLGD